MQIFCADVGLPDIVQFYRGLNVLAHGNNSPRAVTILQPTTFNSDSSTILNDIVADARPSAATE
jgi:hypothetical protein